MKKANSTDRDTLRPEYDREALGKGVRGKFLNSYSKGSNLVLLEPEIAKAFSTFAAVNEALGNLLQLTKQTTKLTHPSGGTPRKRAAS